MAQESIDKSLLQTFVPVNALSGDQLDWLLDQQEVCRYASGDALFRWEIRITPRSICSVARWSSPMKTAQAIR